MINKEIIIIISWALHINSNLTKRQDKRKKFKNTMCSRKYRVGERSCRVNILVGKGLVGESFVGKYPVGESLCDQVNVDWGRSTLRFPLAIIYDE